jgi:hypothetical protein
MARGETEQGYGEREKRSGELGGAAHDETS